MKSVGEILKSKRIEKGLSLEEVQKQTKISLCFLEAIEENDFNRIPNGTTAKGFIRNYAMLLGLSPDYFLAIFRRDYVENQTGLVLPRPIVQSTITPRSWWTPKATVVAVVIGLVLLTAGYLARQYYSLNNGPGLSLDSPKDGQTFYGKVLVSGVTEPDAVVHVQGILIAVEENGHFREEMVLPRGDNIVTVESVNRNNKSRLIKVKIKVE